MKRIVMKTVFQICAALVLCGALRAAAQFPPDFPPDGPPPDFDGPPGAFRQGPGGFGGPGGPMQQEELKVVSKFDKNGDKRLDATERKAAREFVQKENSQRGNRGPGGRRGPGGPGRNENQEPAKPGAKLTPAQVKTFTTNTPLYDPLTLRTIFIQFENADWEKELSDFHNTDVEVPAKLTVDGKDYADVGIHFRGASSYNQVSEGRKRSLNLSMDYANEKQNLGGYRTLNLLNSHDDPSFLRTVLYNAIARSYIPTPKANYVRVVINGESWGVYVNAQQFNKDFLKDSFGTTKGARWKVSGSPRGQGSLAYLGDDAEKYKRIYEIKTKDDAKSWADLIKLCKTLNETPSNKLEAALAPLLDIDGALKFLALENALINNDGYWVRTSDYNLYEDEKGKFHLVAHDTNETFSRPGGPGFGGRGPGGQRGSGFGGRQQGGPDDGGGSGGPRPSGNSMPQVNGVELDPLVAANDSSKPLLSKLLSVPSLRARYLGYVREIAEKWLDWQKLGPLAQQYQSLISADVRADTRKLDSFEDFTGALTGNDLINNANNAGGGEVRRFGPGRAISLKTFAEQRRAYLLRVTAAR
jgi:spore coat protein CotH